MTARAETGQAAAPLAAFADLVDGQSALVHRVALSIVSAELTVARRGAEDLLLEYPDGRRLRWPLSQLRRLRGQAGDDILALSCLTDTLARLYVRDAGARRILAARAPHLARSVSVPGRARLLAWGAGAIASVAAIVFLLVPVLADRLAPLIPPAGERELGDATFRQIRAALSDTAGMELALCDDTAGRAALERIVQRVEGARGGTSPRLAYPLRVHVLDDPMINAFALPGGHVVLFRGILEAARHPEELAAVFAHEIGHVAARDPTRAALRTAGSVGVLGLVLGDFAGGAAVLFLTEQLIAADYSQRAERAADDFAYGLLADAGLRPGALGTMFERLRAEHGDAPGPLRYFLSHPPLQSRIDAARQADRRLTNARRPLLPDGQWRALRRICD
ncbi:M48 family metallopeptidase [Brevirhabdus sp.]|uniref:M48 family metallopeptidase n=1 Tax=Brevirhabdus sp. TaxID=2004514 RepID=UPI00405825F0